MLLQRGNGELDVPEQVVTPASGTSLPTDSQEWDFRFEKLVVFFSFKLVMISHLIQFFN